MVLGTIRSESSTERVRHAHLSFLDFRNCFRLISVHCNCILLTTPFSRLFFFCLFLSFHHRKLYVLYKCNNTNFVFPGFSWCDLTRKDKLVLVKGEAQSAMNKDIRNPKWLYFHVFFSSVDVWMPIRVL